MFRSLPKPARAALLGLAALWVLGTLISVILEVRLPATDVFLFKEAGVNFATKGRFVASNLPHMQPDQELVFSYYPPVFPFVFGLWSKVAGIGIKPSILFDDILKGLRTILILLLVAPQLFGLLRSRFAEKMGIACLVLITLVAFLSTDGDRPDELALIWGLLSWFVIQTKSSKLAKSIGSGALLGLCGATSPAGGIFFGLGFLVRRALRQIKTNELIAALCSAAVMFSLCNLPVRMADPEAFSRFSKQVPLSTLPYQLPFVHGATLAEFFSSLAFPMHHLVDIGLPYLFCSLILSGALIVLWRKGQKNLRKKFATYFWVSILFIPLSLAVWSLQPFYLWFPCLALLIALFGSLPENVRAASGYVTLAFLAFFPILFRELKGWGHAMERGESVENVQKTLESLVPAGSRVAVTPDQYFTLKNKRQISNIGYVCDRLEQYDYIYVTPVTSARRTRPEPFPIPCPEKQSCFTMVSDLTTRRVFKIFGIETGYYVRDNGGVLYKNTRCLASVAKPKP